MRPRFEVALSPAEGGVLHELRGALAAPTPPCLGIVEGRHAELRVLLADEHVFSPVLSLTLEQRPEGTVLKGRFSPHPNVWTCFMAIYGLLLMTATGGAMYGISQWMIQQTPWALLVVPAALLAFGLVFGASFIGQGLGAEQMYVLRRIVDEALEAAGTAGSGSRPSAGEPGGPEG